MERLKARSLLWWPAILLMALIFIVSAQPASSLPNFSGADTIIKKGGHMLGYGLLAWGYWRGLRHQIQARPLAWLLAVAYALTDELHQSFVPGRHPSFEDVFIFDGLGALLALVLASRFMPAWRGKAAHHLDR